MMTGQKSVKQREHTSTGSIGMCKVSQQTGLNVDFDINEKLKMAAAQKGVMCKKRHLQGSSCIM